MNPLRKNQGVGSSNPLSRQILKHLSELSVGAIQGAKVGKTKRGKGTKIMALADCNGLPVAVSPLKVLRLTK
jgi:hypothetical protein